jgi:hypothetical protein
LARANAPHGLQAGLDEAGEMGRRTQAPIGYQPIPLL